MLSGVMVLSTALVRLKGEVYPLIQTLLLRNRRILRVPPLCRLVKKMADHKIVHV